MIANGGTLALAQLTSILTYALTLIAQQVRPERLQRKLRDFLTRRLRLRRRRPG